MGNGTGYTIVHTPEGNYMRADRPERGRFVRKRALFGGVLGAAGLLFFLGTGYSYRPLKVVPPPVHREIPGERNDLAKYGVELGAKHKELQKALAATTPKGVYLVIDRTQNRLYIMKDGETIRTAICSVGSGINLKVNTKKGQKQFKFDTPRGVHKVISRQTSPIWKKPDWAYYEEGKTPPSANASDRFEYGVLGKYALHFGDGYMLHGTLYTRLLGRWVSHGCVRLGAEDLQKVWDMAPIGTPIYIY